MTAILIAIIWILLGGIMGYKQCKCEDDRAAFFIPFIIAPIWFSGAIIRQVFIEDWR